MSASKAERFWRFVKKTPSCWLWQGSVSGGYGMFRDGPMRGAHRVALELSGVIVPPDLDVCHRCDNNICVNPTHLFLGTAKDNSEDAVKKGRAGGWHKLGPQTATAIRRLAKCGVTQKSLAQKFGVTQSNISRLLANKVWREDLC